MNEKEQNEIGRNRKLVDELFKKEREGAPDIREEEEEEEEERERLKKEKKEKNSNSLLTLLDAMLRILPPDKKEQVLSEMELSLFMGTYELPLEPYAKMYVELFKRTDNISKHLHAMGETTHAREMRYLINRTNAYFTDVVLPLMVKRGKLK